MVTLTARQRALSLVPVAALSAAWTAGLASVTGRPGPPVAASAVSPVVPEVVVPTAVTAPASATTVVTSGRRAGLRQVLAGDPVSSIPSQALVDYQRAAMVIAATDPACGLDWNLLAAIGKVESDHGRAADRASALGPDTDGGEYDGDTTHDRAVGPLRFIPSTWSSVKVDGDGDGRRDPQDLGDAALAAAVYLCSGDEDLSTVGGRQAALRRYDPAPGYADLVLGWTSTYATPVPTDGWAFASASAGPARAPSARTHHRHQVAAAVAPVEKPEPGSPAAPPESAQPTAAPAPAPARPDPVRDVLTVAGAQLLCTLDGLSSLLQPGAFRACVDDRLHRTH